MEEYFICPECGSEDVEVIKERGREITLKCNECGHVWIITLPKLKKVPVIVSKHERSFREFAELPEDETVKVGDVIELENDEVRVLSIELPGGKRVRRAKVQEIQTIWGESLTYPKVFGVSIYLPGGITQSFKVVVDRDEEFVVGEVIEVGGYTFKVEMIKTERKLMRSGKAKADKIVRLMGHAIRGRARRKLKIYEGYESLQEEG
ncbi:HVO_0476 family zinc finger protein [Pyrococcus kukulkanii]|uniref:HVO_0476 family zinc finger protein n=1 Tax=Pyrococcus kukulkanii TaxID=1609559 RepID=A0ABV4T2W8_9EURY